MVANTALLLHTRHLYSDHVAKASAAAEMAGRRADEVLDGMLLYGVYLQNRLQYWACWVWQGQGTSRRIGCKNVTQGVYEKAYSQIHNDIKQKCLSENLLCFVFCQFLLYS